MCIDLPNVATNSCEEVRLVFNKNTERIMLINMTCFFMFENLNYADNFTQPICLVRLFYLPISGSQLNSPKVPKFYPAGIEICS